jgi:broad specificity phosphatase PhoE/ribonuclease HI
LKVIVEADGGARGNPGPAGYGAVVLDGSTGEVLAERLAALGVTTNNVAEYSGMIAGLRAAAELGATEVEVRMDSKLVVEQMEGRWKIKHPGLRPLAAQAATLVGQFQVVRFTWIPRERNRRADALANAAMDGKTPEEVTPVAQPKAPAASSWDPPDSGAPLRLLLVRHGETVLNAERRYSGRGDVPLSEIGVAQAAALGRRVAGLSAPVDVVLSSPLARCVRTAEAIATATRSGPVVIEPDLVECDFGEWEGLTFAEVRERYPDELAAWLGSTAVAPPGGESFRDVAARARRVVSTLVSGETGRTVVLVSHVSPIKLMLRDALAATDAFLHRCYLDSAGMSTVDIWSDGGVAVRSVNETAHLAASAAPATAGRSR